ncbi:MAG: ABC transporter permease [Chloroflexota bacterium]
MRQVLLVLRHEILTILGSKSFWFGAVGIPLIGALVFAVAGAINQNTQASDAVSNLLSSPSTAVGEGYVDLGGIIATQPKDIPADKLRSYPDEAAARQALAAGEIAAFFIIPADYVESGKVTYVRPDFNPFSESGQGTLLRRLLRINLLDGDVDLSYRIERPLNLRTKSLAAEPQREESNPMTFFLPYAVTILYYIIILAAASLLLSSVTKEKENRVIEVLMSSVTPTQLLAGKIVGLGLIGLSQMLFWVGTSFVLLRLSGRAFNLPEAFQLPTSFLVWGLLFFLLGYAVYASLMAGVGALVPNLREASQATFVVIMPLIVPMMLISIMIEDSNGILATTLSIFPLTAPVAMMTRLAAGNVPIWQPLLALALLLATAAVIVRAVAGMFRAQTLLSGQSFNVKRFFKALFGQA